MRNEPDPRPFAVALAASSLLIFSLTGAPLAARPAGDGVAGLFGEVIDVRVVNLEVVVEDPEGRRVYGLGPENFILRVDRQPIPLEYFTEVRDGAAVTVVGNTAVEPRPSPVPSLGSGGAVPTNYLVFIDEYFSIARDRDRAVGDLIVQLPSLGTADRMAILAWNGGKLEMLSNWNGSASDLRRVLEAASDRPTSGLQRELELRRSSRLDRYTIRYSARYPSFHPYDDPRTYPENEYLALRLSDHIERMMRAATTALRGFARPPGRKAMLLLAGGWPYNPWDALVLDTYGPARFSPALEYGPCRYRQLYDTANRLGYTLYPVDVRNFGAGVRASAGHRSPDEARYEWELFADREWSEHSTLKLLAHQTGGQALLNRGARTALEQVVSDTRSYYWLGFTPTWQGVDRRHRVEIFVTPDPRLMVRSRRSFSDLSRSTEVDMLVESALLFGDPPGPRMLAAKLGEAQGAGFRKIEVPLAVVMPLGALTFLPTRDGWTAEVELRVVVEDQHGDRNEIAVVPLSYTSESAPGPRVVGRFNTTIKLRRLRHDVVVSVHDPLSGRILWTRLEFDPRG